MKLHTQLLYTLAVALFCVAVSGCTNLDQWQAVAASGRIGAYSGQTSQDWNNSARSADSENWGVYGEIQPFAFLDMKMRAEANARAIVEQRYRERPEPVEAEKPKPVCPHGGGHR